MHGKLACIRQRHASEWSCRESFASPQCCFSHQSFRLTGFVIFLTLLTLLGSCEIQAQFGQAAAPARLISLSGQFVARDERHRGPSDLALKLATSNQYVCLDPALVTVSCERIKRHVRERLAVSAPWPGRVFLNIHAAQFVDEPVGLVSERFGDGWQYRLDLPDLIDRPKYVRAITQALLLQAANRSNPPRSAELPLWLVEGFTRHLLASSELQIVLQPPTRSANGLSIGDSFYESRRPTTFASQRDDPMAVARAILRTNAYYSFEQLSWPAEDQLAAEQRDLFACSAELFVTDLLGMKSGKANMLGFLDQLPNYYNWQLAFLAAFHDSFTRPLDVEKWWNLHWITFTAREPTHRWLVTESLSRLEQALQAPVETRSDSEHVPQRAESSLQTVIGKWNENTGTKTLEAKLHEFDALRFNLDPRVVPILDDYKRVLAGFLKDSNPSGITAMVRRKAAIESARLEAIKQLDLLDAQRHAMATQPETFAYTLKLGKKR